MEVASQRLEVDVSDLEWVEGAASVKGTPTRRVTLAEAAQAATAMSAPLSEDFGFHLTSEDRFQPAGIAFSNAVHAAVVQVDARTGVVEILRYAVVHDCGTVVNPVIVEGQVHGGISYGVSMALFEELIYDDQAQLLNANFADYLLPTCDGVPSLTTARVEIPSTLNPEGYKGAGEVGDMGPAPALAAAVEDALAADGRVRLQELPITPERLFRAMEAGER